MARKKEIISGKVFTDLVGHVNIPNASSKVSN